MSDRTGVPTRMIRYYEEQGLLEPRRGPNGYRVYGEQDVDRVRRIRNLIAAGMPSRLIRVVLDMEQPSWTRACSQEFADMLGKELVAIEERMACLSASRATLREFLSNARVTAENV